MKYESEVGMVLEEITDEIRSSDTFKNTPIFYDFMETDANNLPPECIVYKLLEWKSDNTHCNYESQLDIVLAITTEERRDGVVGKLLKFREKLKEVTDDYSMRNPYLTFIHGSPIQGFSYIRESPDSYKETKQLFTTGMAVLSYKLRY